MKLYHGTSESPTKIRREGLKPPRCGPCKGLVFLADNPELAINYALTDQERTGKSKITLVEVDTAYLNPRLLIPDPHHEQWLTDEQGDYSPVETWQDSLRASDQCAYAGKIPIRAIVIVNLV